MLFFAVFCGFIAENLREHEVEEAKGKMYVVSLIEDLAADTTNLNMVLLQYDTLNLRMDTLINYFHLLGTGFNDTLFRNITAVLGFPDFIYTDRTMQQLKNSGGMQLIHSKAAADGIVRYDSKVHDLDIDVASLNDIFNSNRCMWYEVLNLAALSNDVNSMTTEEIKKLNKTYVLKNDKATLGKWNNMIFDYQGIELMVEKQEQQLKQKAIDLITLLKKEYDLK